jgi:hypothetical protein
VHRIARIKVSNVELITITPILLIDENDTDLRFKVQRLFEYLIDGGNDRSTVGMHRRECRKIVLT